MHSNMDVVHIMTDGNIKWRNLKDNVLLKYQCYSILEIPQHKNNKNTMKKLRRTVSYLPVDIDIIHSRPRKRFLILQFSVIIVLIH